VENSDFYYTVIIFLLFLIYGFSNLYIIIFLRKKENYIVGLFEFITLFMGNIKNYINMNKRFRESFISEETNGIFNKSIAVMHLLSPMLIPIFILFWVISIGLY
jgi:hypothetical protein